MDSYSYLSIHNVYINGGGASSRGNEMDVNMIVGA